MTRNVSFAAVDPKPSGKASSGTSRGHDSSSGAESSQDEGEGGQAHPDSYLSQRSMSGIMTQGTRL